MSSARPRIVHRSQSRPTAAFSGTVLSRASTPSRTSRRDWRHAVADFLTRARSLVRRPMTMSRELHRTADDGDTPPRHPAPEALSTFREQPAYVLLGDRAWAKTTASGKRRAPSLPRKLIARAILATSTADAFPEWKDKDPADRRLDEVRAGQHDPRLPLDRSEEISPSSASLRSACPVRHATAPTTEEPHRGVAVGGLHWCYRSIHSTRGTPKDLQARAMSTTSPPFPGNTGPRHGCLLHPAVLDLSHAPSRTAAGPPATETFEKHAWRWPAIQRRTSACKPQTTPAHLDTVGRLCAVLLVSVTSGFATVFNKADADHPFMTVCGRPTNDCRQAVASKLFRHPAEGRAEPVHRQVAEYVAARHIAKLIQHGLPSLRVLALISGPDGNVVSELRGLSAWLAAHSPVARHHLIHRDPTGLALYGDIQALSPDQHQALFDSLVREPRQLEPTYRTAPAFAPLATPTMQPVLERAIRNPPDGPDGELGRRLRTASSSTKRRHCQPVPHHLLETARDDSRMAPG